MRLERWQFALCFIALGCQAQPGDSSGTRGNNTNTAVGAQAGGNAAGNAGDGMPTAGSTAGGQAGSASGDGGMAMGMDKPKHIVPPTPPAPEPCQQAGCPPDLICADDGVCTTPPPECLGDADCADGQRCGVTGECLDPGECRFSADCGMAEGCRANVCTLGSDCGQTELLIEPIPPNLLVLFDISGSMNEDLTGVQGCVEIPNFITCLPTKITIASQTMTQMTARYASDIYWGLAMFPGDGQCGAPVDVIAPAAGNADMVAMRVANTFPSGMTPINTAVASIQASTYLNDPARKNFMLLLSDGGETCDGDNANTTSRIGEMAADGINTFVVGFGGGIDANVLNDFGNAGGVPNTNGNNSFYQADSAAALETALGAILDRVVGCDFALSGPPDDPDQVWAFLDDVMVERDSPDGWLLDTTTNTVTFMGAACAQLQDGTSSDIDIVFGCPEPILE